MVLHQTIGNPFHIGHIYNTFDMVAFKTFNGVVSISNTNYSGGK